MRRRQNHDTETGVRCQVDGGPWEDRRGAWATIITGSMRADLYPRHGLGKTECIIVLDNDPLNATAVTTPGEAAWTCVIDRRDLYIPSDHGALT